MRPLLVVTNVIVLSYLPTVPAFSQSADPAAAQGHSAKELFDRGCQALERADTTNAVQLLRRAVAARPDPAYVCKLAEAFCTASQARNAERVLTIALERNPHALNLHVALARQLTARAAFAEAIPHYRAADECLSPTDYLDLARGYRATDAPRLASNRLDAGVKRHPADRALRAAWINDALDRAQWATALHRIRDSVERLGPCPQYNFYAARAYFHQGTHLGPIRALRVRNGRVGDFARGCLLFRALRGQHAFAACPAESALYQVRKAIDDGLDTPEVHLLHARIWLTVGRADVAHAILESRAAVLLGEPIDDALALFADVSLARGDLADYLQFMHRRAALDLEKRDDLLFDAYLKLAEAYNARGEEVLFGAFLYRALQLRPHDATLLARVANIEWEAGRERIAAKLYRKLLALDPAHEQRMLALERLAAPPDADPHPGRVVIPTSGNTP